MTSAQPRPQLTTRVLRGRRTIFALAIALGYSVLFLLAYPRTGPSVASLGAIPVALLGFLFGLRGGIVAGVGIFGLTQILYGLVGYRSLALSSSSLVGGMVLILTGAAAGGIIELLKRSRAQVRTLNIEVARREAAEVALIQARIEAEAANQAKSSFLANMSHELRTPLNAIIGYSEMLQDEAEDGGYSQLVPDLRKIQSAGHHLLTLINDVLDLSKIEAGRMELHPERFEVAAMINAVQTTVHPMVQQQRNTLRIEIAPELGTIVADRTRVQQVLLNLLSNAAKFTKEGTITLEVFKRAEGEGSAGGEHAGEWIFFRVVDTGIGMSQTQLGELFRPFTQLHGSQHTGGTGLGLTISRHFCRMMGGDITVESEAGRGSRFTVHLPVEVRQPLATQSVQATP